MLASIAAADEPGKGILWRVERNGQPVGHLLGTVHSDRPEVVELPPPIQRAFDRARRYAFELDLATLDPGEAARFMRLDGGRSLPDVLPRPLWQRVVEAAGQRGLNGQSIRAFKPWALAIMLSLPPTDARRVLDHRLQQRARERGHPITGLETMAQQLSVFDDLGIDKQIDLLRQALDQVESGRARSLYNDLIDAWLARDLARIAELARDHPALPDNRDNLALMDELLHQRNRRMVERMEAEFEAGGAFVAVGALHLPGENGLIRLLEQRGYRLEPVY